MCHEFQSSAPPRHLHDPRAFAKSVMSRTWVTRAAHVSLAPPSVLCPSFQARSECFDGSIDSILSWFEP